MERDRRDRHAPSRTARCGSLAACILETCGCRSHCWKVCRVFRRENSRDTDTTRTRRRVKSGGLLQGDSPKTVKRDDMSKVRVDVHVTVQCAACAAYSINRIGNLFKGWCQTP